MHVAGPNVFFLEPDGVFILLFALRFFLRRFESQLTSTFKGSENFEARLYW